MSGLTVKHRGREQLVLERSRRREFLALVLALGFLFSWYFILNGGRTDFGALDPGAASRGWMWWLGMLAPLALVPRIFRALRVVLFGERWEFIGRTRELRRNGRVVMGFTEARSVEVARTESSRGDEYESSDSYRLIICGKGTKTIVLDRTTDHPAVLSMSKEVADILGVRVFYRRA